MYVPEFNPTFSIINDLKEEIDQTSINLGKTERVFRESSMRLPKYTCYEAGFIKTVSWLHSLYQESGKPSIDYLLDKFTDYEIDLSCSSRLHKLTVYHLRTTLQHDLDLKRERSKIIYSSSDEWFNELLNLSNPSENSHWEICLEKILNEAKQLFFNTLECVKSIEKDEFRESIISEWNYRCTRYHPKEEFDRIIHLVASDLGMDHIDPVKVRNRYSDTWVKELELLSGDYDFDLEVRKRVESVLIDNPLLPITGNDIMEEFFIKPGTEVAKLLSLAQEIYKKRYCGKKELLTMLRAELNKL